METHTQRRERSHEEGGRHCRDASASQLGGRQGMGRPSEPPEGACLASTVVLDFETQGSGTRNAWCSKPPVCGSLFQQPQDAHTTAA